MPDVRSVVKKMIEDGESEDVISAVVKRLKGSEIKSGLPDMSPELAAPPPRDEYKGPDTFWGGVKNSLFGKEFDETARKSLTGFAKGAILDIPSTVIDTVKGMNAGGQSLYNDPAAHFRAMGPAFREMGQGMLDTVKNAGADPEAFGRMAGQFTGQPLVTEGIGAGVMKGAPMLRAPVSKALSSTGKFLAEPKGTVTHPVTPRMLGLRTLRKGVSKVGEQMQRSGEKMRMKASNVETAGEAAARTKPNPPPNEKVYAGGGTGETRPRPVRQTPRVEVDKNTEFTRPITETAEQLAARNRPSVFTGGQSRRSESIPFEPRPADTTPYPVPGEIPPGIPGEAPLVRDTTPYEAPPTRPPGIPPEIPIPPVDPFAPPAGKIPLKGGRLKQNRRTQSAPYEPSIDPFAPPSLDLTIPVGEGGQSSRYRHDPFEFGQEPIGELGLPPTPKKRTPAPPTEAPKFEPSVDPAANFSPEDIALMQAKRAEIKAALEKMAGGELVDPTTGEITTPPRTKGPWRMNEGTADDAGRQFADEVESSRYPGDEAYDLGEISPNFRNNQSMPDWGPPEPRTIQPEEWGDWGDLTETIPTLVPDANGSHVAAPAKVRPGVNPLRPEVPPGQVTNRSMFQLSEQRAAEGRVNPGREFADSIAPNEFSEDMMFTPEELGPSSVPPQEISPFENQFDPRISGLDPTDIFEGSSPNFGTTNDSAKGRLVKTPKEKNFPSVVPESFEKVGKGRQVGPKGASYRVKDPSGKHLGDINVTPKDIAEIKAVEEYSHFDDGDIADLLYQTKLEEMLEKHGFSSNEAKIDIQPKTTRTKDVPLTDRSVEMPATATSEIPIGSEGMESLTDFSGTGREPRFPGDKSKGTNKSAFAKEAINPDKDFGPSGDIKPIIQEAQRLDYDKAVDTKYKSLLPKEMRTELAPGETYKGKLQALIEIIKSELGPEQGTARLKEMDAFLESTRNATGAEALPEIPLLPKFGKMDLGALSKGKLDKKLEPWYSPRVQQQFNASWRKRTGQEPKKPKK